MNPHSDQRQTEDLKLLSKVGELSFPERVVVGEDGAYWRDFSDHYSMCPVSNDNDPVHPVAVYIPEWRLDAEQEERRDLESELSHYKHLWEAGDNLAELKRLKEHLESLRVALLRFDLDCMHLHEQAMADPFECEAFVQGRIREIAASIPASEPGAL